EEDVDETLLGGDPFGGMVPGQPPGQPGQPNGGGEFGKGFQSKFGDAWSEEARIASAEARAGRARRKEELAWIERNIRQGGRLSGRRAFGKGAHLRASAEGFHLERDRKDE